MKYIKIYEDFSANSEINENAKEIPLADGIINLHVDDANPLGVSSTELGVTYFRTNTAAESDENFPYNLEIYYTKGSIASTISFDSNNRFSTQDSSINLVSINYKDIQPGFNNIDPFVLAKSPEEAGAKAFEILAEISRRCTKTPGDPKFMGNIVRSFLQVRKLYPDYAQRNSLFNGFIQGIAKIGNKSTFGRLSGADGFRQKESETVVEVKRALKEFGAI